jgi:hypothetical protein
MCLATNVFLYRDLTGCFAIAGIPALLCKITIPDRDGILRGLYYQSTNRKENRAGCVVKYSMWQSIYAVSLQHLGNGWGIFSAENKLRCGYHQDLRMDFTF